MAKRKASVDKSKWTLEELYVTYENPYKYDLSIREMLRNHIRTTSSKYNGKDYTTTLDSTYFLMHGHKKKDVNSELSKWVDLTGVDLNTPIKSSEKFFHDIS